MNSMDIVCDLFLAALVIFPVLSSFRMVELP